MEGVEDWKGSASDTSDLISRAPVSSILPVFQSAIRNPQSAIHGVLSSPVQPSRTEEDHAGENAETSSKTTIVVLQIGAGYPLFLCTAYQGQSAEQGKSYR
jgi:hypothetical protein